MNMCIVSKCIYCKNDVLKECVQKCAQKCGQCDQKGHGYMKNVKWKNILQLQAVVIIYTISSVMAKAASGHKEEHLLFLLFFGLEFILLGIYALLWQQMIKKFELSVAYANRAMAILWSMIWAVLFFHDRITIRNIVGVAIVLVGIVLVNTDKEAEQ